MDCSSLPSLELAEWTAELLEPLKGQRFPLAATFELTDRCNLKCVHCYINQPAGSILHRTNELTTEQVKQVLDKMVDAGTLFVTLTGGEALLRQDFPEIYMHAKKRGLLMTVFTNGTLITEEIADLFASYPPVAVELTMYGATRETYEKVTNSPITYDRAMRGVKMLADRGIKLVLKAFVLTINRHEFLQIAAMAEEIGAGFRSDATIWPRLDGSREALKYQLPLDELVDFEHSTPEKLSEWVTLAKMNGKMVRGDHLFNCGAGQHSYHVDSLGRVSVCLAVRNPMYDLKELSFEEAWRLLGEQTSRKRQHTSVCSTCAVGNLCDLCPGWSQHVHGDDESLVESVCKLGYKRLERLKPHLV